MPRPTIIGLSGPSSSGKTTLARLLRSIFPGTLLLHEDDFYRPEHELPFRRGLRDWDCAAALDMPSLEAALGIVRAHGRLPDGLVSKEDRNAVGAHTVPAETVARLQEVVAAVAAARLRSAGEGEGERRTLVVLEGFLLFGESVRAVREGVDVRLLLRATRAAAVARRQRRAGYVTLEGFWEDPPGYVEQVVWPGYVEEHGFLFEGGDVEGAVDEGVVARLGIRVCPGGGAWPMEKVLEWAVERVLESLAAEGEGSGSACGERVGEREGS
ncbi:ribosylnicotinamide kinase [Xylographa opegraphella]|nr:ribosylnicotinamide kinase [Xylographa opegraphella]